MTGGGRSKFQECDGEKGQGKTQDFILSQRKYVISNSSQGRMSGECTDMAQKNRERRSDRRSFPAGFDPKAVGGILFCQPYNRWSILLQSWGQQNICESSRSSRMRRTYKKRVSLSPRRILGRGVHEDSQVLKKARIAHRGKDEQLEENLVYSGRKDIVTRALENKGNEKTINTPSGGVPNSRPQKVKH